MSRAWHRAAACVVALMLAACTGGESASPPAASTPATGMKADAADTFKVELSRPQPGSSRARALAALERAGELTLYSLQPWTLPVPVTPMPEAGSPEYTAYSHAQSQAWKRSQREWCTREACVHRNKLLGRVRVRAGQDAATVATALRESLRDVPDYASACIPEYRHAVEFRADGGHVYLALLCYGCGQVAVAIDGELGHDEQTYNMGDERALDAILRSAGVPLAAKRG